MAEVLDFEKFKNKKTDVKEKKGEKEPLVEEVKTESPQAKDMTARLAEKKAKDNLRLLTLLIRKYADMSVINQRIGRMLQLTRGNDLDTLEKRKNIVRKYSTEQILGWFSEKEAEEWTRKPALFHAIAHEVGERVWSALDTLEKINDSME